MSYTDNKPESMASTDSSLTAPERGTFRFVDLPPELRLTIFEMVAFNSAIRLSTYGGKKPGGWPGVCCVSHQIRNEVMPVIYKCAAFEARVRDMDFDDVITFVQRSSLVCRKALHYNTRFMVFIDGYSSFLHAYEDLHIWLRFQSQHISSTGPLVKWRYGITELSYYNVRFWEMGEEFLHDTGYLELHNLHAELFWHPLHQWALGEIMRGMWAWAHPEVSSS